MHSRKKDRGRCIVQINKSIKIKFTQIKTLFNPLFIYANSELISCSTLLDIGWLIWGKYFDGFTYPTTILLYNDVMGELILVGRLKKFSVTRKPFRSYSNLLWKEFLKYENGLYLFSLKNMLCRHIAVRNCVWVVGK